VNAPEGIVNWMHAQKCYDPGFWIGDWASLKRVSEHLGAHPLVVLKAYELMETQRTERAEELRKNDLLFTW
jgi:hypothetical protein